MSTKLADFLDPKGDNFLGTGLSVSDPLFEGTLRRIENSFPTLMGDERKHRLQIILELSRELEKIKLESNYCVGLGEAAIEAVINGDWTDMNMWASHFKFKEEDTFSHVDAIKRWKKFVGILEMAEMNGVMN